MGSFFNIDNKFFIFMSRVADLIVLNVLFIVCCFPLITIGASITALYYVTLKMVKNEESYIVKSFFHSFKQNFKQGTIIWIILSAFALIIYLNYQYYRLVSDKTAIFFYIICIVLMFYIFTISYIFPIVARFDNTIKNTFQDSIFLSIRHLPSTVFICLIFPAFPVMLFLFVPSLFLHVLILWIFFGFSLLAYLNSIMFERIFAYYMPKQRKGLIYDN